MFPGKKREKLIENLYSALTLISKLLSKNEELKARIEHIETELFALVEEVAAKIEANRMDKAEIEGLKKKLARSTERIDTLLGEKSFCEGECRSKDVTISVLRTDAANLRLKIENLEATVRELTTKLPSRTNGKVDPKTTTRKAEIEFDAEVNTPSPVLAKYKHEEPLKVEAVEYYADVDENELRRREKTESNKEPNIFVRARQKLAYLWEEYKAIWRGERD